MMDDKTDIDHRAEKMSRLVRENHVEAAQHQKWSRFVRRMRLILPLAALGLFTIVFVWSDVQRNHIIPIKPPSGTPVASKNELVNPRFESTDSNNQPFTLTAKHAVHDQGNDNIVLLTEPVGDILLKNGEWIAIKSRDGTFHQDSKLLLLRGNVQLYHDKGYVLEMQELELDLNNNAAVSNVDVTGHGPAGTLEAKGLSGNSEENILIFNGPAKLVLTNISGGTKGLLP